MARSWTRLHEFLGSPPGPVTYELVSEAVRRKLGESDDLDWKQARPAASPVKGEWNEFAKDVAAMANTRGGRLVYGVSDAIDMVGIDQPTVSGVSYLMLPATDGSGKDVLVVDIPASETAPHFLYGWQQKDKDKTTFNAPFRHRDDTACMADHQVASAYRERFSRQDAAEAALERLTSSSRPSLTALLLSIASPSAATSSRPAQTPTASPPPAPNNRRGWAW
jgi:hypothetical protein